MTETQSKRLFRSCLALVFTYLCIVALIPMDEEINKTTGTVSTTTTSTSTTSTTVLPTTTVTKLPTTTTIPPTTTTTQPVTTTTVKPTTTTTTAEVDTIQISGSVWDMLAECETGGNWSHPPVSIGYSGGLMFHHKTWTAMGGGKYASQAYLASRQQQIAIAEKLLADAGNFSPWPGCRRKLGLA
jgi:resuscitation-promoting factor RpfB